MQPVGNRIEIGGALTLDTATAALASGRAALSGQASAVLDLGKVEGVDSAGLAVIFAWLRDAQATQRQLTLANPPQQLLSLAAVYGVSDMLPLA